jgi:hypothetical protein
MPNCNVKQLLCGLRLITAEFMHYDVTTSAGPECRDDIGVADLGEFMPLPRKSSDVIPEGFDRLLPTALQIPRVVGLHVCALEVTGEDLLEILLAINHVSRQVVEPGPGHVGQVNGEELDDEEIIVRPTRPTHEAVVLQPNTGICLNIVFDDVIWCPETFWETRVMHIIPERLGP